MNRYYGYKRLIIALRHSPRPDERHGVVKKFVEDEERGGWGGDEVAAVDAGVVDVWRPVRKNLDNNGK